MTGCINGIFVPVITPFQRGSQKLDRGLLGDHIQRLNETQVSGFMPLGSNGEAAMMTDEEAIAVVRTVKDHADAEKVVFAGTGRESLKNTVEFTKAAADAGAAAAFVLTPHYFKAQMTQECLEYYYEGVADQSPIPIILYHAPGYASGVGLTPETVKRLSGHGNIIGMKDTSPDPMESFIQAAPEGFAVLAGSFHKFLEGVEKGAAGGVLSCANYIPDLCCVLYQKIRRQDHASGWLYGRMKKMIGVTVGPYGVAGVKAAMNQLGYPCGITREPLIYPDMEEENKLGDILKEFIKEIEEGAEECR